MSNISDSLIAMFGSGEISLGTVIILFVVFGVLQAAFQRFSTWSWRKTVEKDVDLYKKLHEIELLRSSEEDNLGKSAALNVLKKSIDERVESGSLRKERVLSMLTTMPMTSIGSVALCISLVFSFFTSGGNLENITTGDISYLACFCLILVLLFLLFDIVLLLLRKVWDKAYASIRDIITSIHAHR